MPTCAGGVWPFAAVAVLAVVAVVVFVAVFAVVASILSTKFSISGYEPPTLYTRTPLADIASRPTWREEAEDNLPVYVAEQLPHIRVGACDTCKSRWVGIHGASSIAMYGSLAGANLFCRLYGRWWPLGF